MPNAGEASPRAKKRPSAHARSRRAPQGRNRDTARELLRLDARVAELESERANLERFAAVAAHELMEPLVMTEACAALLLQRLGTDLDPECRFDLEALSCNMGQARVVVETLLYEAHSANRVLPREPVDLRGTVNSAVSLLRYEIARRHAQVVVKPLPVVEGDRSLLGALMKNLLANALRYGPRQGGTIRVAASCARGRRRISVFSEGRPISAGDRKRIFAPFERGRVERRSTGAGLGLAICQTIVERHGGVMGVQPYPGGNRFYFTIPA